MAKAAAEPKAAPVPKKKIASTLKSVLDHPAVEAALDRTQDIIPTAEKLIGDWTLDLYTRNPGPALNTHGEFMGTDLDLATALFALTGRGAVINIPEYKTMRAATQKANERVVSKDNRHGAITGLYSNAEVFSFGVRINDYNVVKTNTATGKEQVGAPRNFTLVDVTGKWHEGWHHLEFVPNQKENDFLTDKKLWTGNDVVFSHFIHPNRWVSFYGQAYFVLKVVIDRLTSEAEYLNKRVKELKAAGVQMPSKGGGAAESEYQPTQKVGAEKDIIVKAFEVEVDVPDAEGDFPAVAETSDALYEAYERRKRIVYDLKPRLQFAARSVEYAFRHFGFAENAGPDTDKPAENLPTWITATWERGYVQKGKKKSWNRLVLFQPAVGEEGVSLRYRLWDKKEKIADEAV